MNKILVRFDQVAQSISERVDDPAKAGVDRYVGLEHLDPESLEITRWGSPGDVEATKLRFYPGDVIYGRRRAYQRKLGVARFDGICSAHALVLRAKPDVCMPEFLPYFLHSDQFHERALEISVGSLSPTINWSTLRAQEFELPSLDEQARIVELLSSVDFHYANLVQLRSSAEASKISKCDHLIRATELGRASLRKLGDLMSIVRGGSPRPISEYVTDDDDGINWIKIGDVEPSGKYIQSTEEKIIPEGEKKSRRVSPGDFLLSNSMSFGRPYITNIDGCVHDGWLVLQNFNAHFDRDFLFELLSSDALQVKFRQLASGSGVKNLNIDLVSSIEVVVPTRIEQEEIVRELDIFSRVMSECDAGIRATRALRSALVNQKVR